MAKTKIQRQLSSNYRSSFCWKTGYIGIYSRSQCTLVYGHNINKPQCTENPIYVFPEMKPCGLVPISYIRVYVSHLYIPRIGMPISLQQSRQTDPGNISICSQIHECGNWEAEHYNSVSGNNETAVSFLGIHNRNQTYIRFSPALHLQCTHLLT